MKLDFDKFKCAVHYVIWKAGSHQGFGSTKLNKALWFAEARVYALKGHPITGAKYTRQEFGPVPDPVMPARDALKKAGIIEIWKEGQQTKFRTKTKPDMAGFADYEIAALDFWIKEIDEEHTAQSISDKSHEYGWEIARMGEEIPLYAIRAEKVRHAKDEELEWAHKEAKRLGLK